MAFEILAEFDEGNTGTIELQLIGDDGDPIDPVGILSATIQISDRMSRTVLRGTPTPEDIKNLVDSSGMAEIALREEDTKILSSDPNVAYEIRIITLEVEVANSPINHKLIREFFYQVNNLESVTTS